METNPTIFGGIPKVFYGYWDGSPLSYLQYLTVVTFKKFNPDWRVVIYMPEIRFEKKTWTTFEQKAVYTGKNYLEDLLKLDIEVRKINFETIGFRNDISEVIKSDYLRYWLLGNYGGLWSDMDIIYINPIDKLVDKNLAVYGNINKIDTVICYFNSHYPVGFFLSCPNNPYFLELANNSKKYLNINEYQSIGCKLLKILYNIPQNIIKKYPNLNILIMDKYSYLPYDWNKINEIFQNSVLKNIKPYTIGIHWFNGSPSSVNYENLIDQKKLPTTGSIYPFIKEYLEI